MSENTPKKQNLAHLWKPGQSGNPAGKPKGSKHKLGEAFVADLHAHWLANGVAALDKCFEDDAVQYCKIVASVIPKEIALTKGDEAALTKDELRAALSRLDSILGPAEGEPAGAIAGGGSPRTTDPVH